MWAGGVFIKGIIKLGSLLILLILLLAGCGDAPAPAVNSFSLSEIAVEIEVGDAVKLEVVIQPEDADVPEVVWLSSDPGIATVDSMGNVTAHAAGTATISAVTKDAKYTAECQMDVKKKAVRGVRLSHHVLTLHSGKSEQLVATLSPPGVESDLQWASDNPAIAAVSDTGEITAISEGTAVITATTVEGGYTVSCTVTVQPEPAPAVTGEDLALGDFTIQDDETSITERLGTPLSKDIIARENWHDPESYIYFTTWNFEGLKFVFWTTQPKSDPEPEHPGQLLSIITDSNKYATPRGVRGGDAFSRVKELYGKESYVTENVYYYEDDIGYSYVGFTVDHDAVTEIEVTWKVD